MFTIDGDRFKGFGGCNGLGGSYKLTGKNGIKINVISTQMYCDRMETENVLTNALIKADHYTIKGDALQLLQGDMVLATFEAVYF
jgi:heat shock protein HslJ